MPAETFKFGSGLNLDRVGTAVDENDFLHVCVKALNGKKDLDVLGISKCVRTREARPIRDGWASPLGFLHISHE